MADSTRHTITVLKFRESTRAANGGKTLRLVPSQGMSQLTNAAALVHNPIQTLTELRALAFAHFATTADHSYKTEAGQDAVVHEVECHVFIFGSQYYHADEPAPPKGENLWVVL